MNNSEFGATGAPPPAYPPAYHDSSAYPEKSGPPPSTGYPNYPTQPPPPGGYAPPPQQYPQQPGVGAYGGPQAPGTTFVYVQQPTPLTNPPNDYFGYSVFVTVCCCFLIGIFAIMKSMECRTASTQGNRPLAEQKSQEARKLAHIGLGVGILVTVIVIVVVIVKIAVAVSYGY